MPPRMTLEQAHTQGFEVVCRATEGFADVVLSLTPEELARPVPGMDWNVGEVVAHVRSVYERYTLDPTRVPDVADLARQNADDIERVGVDPVAAIASMREQLATLGVVLPRIPPDRNFPFHGGGTITMAGGWGNLMGELLVHGDDIARATDRPLPVAASDLEVTWCYTIPSLSPWLAPPASGDVVGDDVSWDVVFDFGTINLRFVNGTLEFGVDDDLPSPADHHVIQVDDAIAFTLAVPYGRRAPRDEDTALLARRFLPV